MPGREPGGPMCLALWGEHYLVWEEILLSGGVTEVSSDVMHLICASTYSLLYAVEYYRFPHVKPLL